MPRGRKNKGELFDIGNLEEAKQILDSIAGSIAKHKGLIPENQIKNTQKIIDLFSKLESMSNKSFKQYNLSLQTTLEDFEAIADSLRKSLDLQELQIYNEAQRQIKLEETKKLIEEQTKQQEKLNKEMNSTEKELRKYTNTWQQQTKFSLSNLGDSLFGDKLNSANEKDNKLKQEIVNKVIDKHRQARYLN